MIIEIPCPFDPEPKIYQQVLGSPPVPSNELSSWGERYVVTSGLEFSTDSICPVCKQSSIFFFEKNKFSQRRIDARPKPRCKSIVIGFTLLKQGRLVGVAAIQCPICKEKFAFGVSDEFAWLFKPHQLKPALDAKIPALVPVPRRFDPLRG